MKKVAVVTTIFEINEFSVTTVAENQIRMLLDHGYDVRVLVSKGTYQEAKDGSPIAPAPFTEVPPPSVWNSGTVDLRPVFPALKLTDEITDDFEDKVEAVLATLHQHLDDVDVAITHEIFLHMTHLPYNVAMRQYVGSRIVEGRPLLLLNWMHSRPEGISEVPPYPKSCRYTPVPGYIVYPNETDKAQVVGAYNMNDQPWKVRVSRACHAIDPLHDAHPLTRDLVEKSDFFKGTPTGIYPARMDVTKQTDKVIRLVKGIKTLGFSPRWIIIPFQSMGARFQAHLAELEALIKGMHLEREVLFATKLNDDCSQGVPHQVIHELFRVSTMYINPSAVETLSLPVHEAMLAGNLCVLNFDMEPIRELYGAHGLYVDFGSITQQREYSPSIQKFFNDEAGRIMAEWEMNRAVQAKAWAISALNPQEQWRDFAPLLHLPPVGED